MLECEAQRRRVLRVLLLAGPVRAVLGGRELAVETARKYRLCQAAQGDVRAAQRPLEKSGHKVDIEVGDAPRVEADAAPGTQGGGSRTRDVPDAPRKAQGGQSAVGSPLLSDAAWRRARYSVG